jgi:hypothetical protein
MKAANEASVSLATGRKDDVTPLARNNAPRTGMSAAATTNCPMGGDAVRGGRTVVDFNLHAGSGEVEILPPLYAQGCSFRITVRGDWESNELADLLDFAAQAIRAKHAANEAHDKVASLTRNKGDAE